MARCSVLAEVSFKEIQNQMQCLAPLVAKEKGWSATDYRDVIKELRKKQLVGEAILPHYQARIRQVEDIIRKMPLLVCCGSLRNETPSAHHVAPGTPGQPATVRIIQPCLVISFWLE